jgi:DNA repair protein RadB
VNVLNKISTGCRTIDKLLGGGVPSESITLIYGEAETGKTTLALQCTLACARQGYKTLFVDCDGTFSARRLSQIASERFEEMAELIIFMRPNDFREQATVIDQLTDYVTKNFGLIVFDTFNSLYRLRIAESPSRTFELNRELNRQLAVLAQIAKTQKIAVLITSQVHSVLNAIPVTVEPVATRVLKFWADTVIAIKPTENVKMINMTLEKNPQKLPSRTCSLRIEETGIREYSTH